MNFYFFKKRIFLYFVFIFICELIQCFFLFDDNFIYGDFYTELSNSDVIPISLFLSLLTWGISYYIIVKFSSKKNPRFNLNANLPIVFIFLINLFITVYTGQGVVGAGLNSSYLSIFLAFVPINYLITINFLSGKNKFPLFIISAIYIFIDLYRSFLGAILHVFYLCFVTIRSKKFILISIISILLISQPLLEYKNEKRGSNEINFDIELVIKVITSRLTLISTFQFGIENAERLSYMCNSDEYANIMVSSITAVIPKKLLGIESSKTFNNCLIEYHLNRIVDDSSVNSPWILNLYLNLLHSNIGFFFYFSYSIFLISFLMFITNYLFGYNSIVFSSITIPSFISTGNILYLSIPLYFLSIILLFNILLRNNK